MVLVKVEGSKDLWNLLGTRKDFEALRNVLGAAHDGGTSFSSTESTVLHEVLDAIYRDILRG